MQLYYSNEDVEKDKRPSNLIPFRKLKLSSHINQAQSDKRISTNLREKFGKDCITILGNLSAGRTQYQEPIRGKELRRMLTKEEFQVYLLDEFKTSSVCPSCNQKLETFKEYANPSYSKMPWAAQVILTYFIISMKSLNNLCFRCSNPNCLKQRALTDEVSQEDNKKYRLWNRDLAAVLNCRKIVFSLRATSQKPASFLRNQKVSLKRKNPDPTIGLEKKTPRLE
jgi:hypothetical protein